MLLQCCHYGRVSTAALSRHATHLIHDDPHRPSLCVFLFLLVVVYLKLPALGSSAWPIAVTHASRQRQHVVTCPSACRWRHNRLTVGRTFIPPSSLSRWSILGVGFVERHRSTPAASRVNAHWCIIIRASVQRSVLSCVIAHWSMVILAVAYWSTISPVAAHWSVISLTASHWSVRTPAIAHWSVISPAAAR